MSIRNWKRLSKVSDYVIELSVCVKMYMTEPPEVSFQANCDFSSHLESDLNLIE